MAQHQPLLEYLFTHSDDKCKQVINELAQQVVTNTSASDFEAMHAFVQQYTTQPDSTDMHFWYLLLLIVLPELPNFIAHCKTYDRPDRVDAFVVHVRRLRVNWLHLELDTELGCIFHAADFVYRCILYYHCL
jgi:hypothetical protein